MEFEKELTEIEFRGGDIDMEALYNLVDKLEATPSKRKFIPAIFNFFEKHSDKNLGSPGPLVHFLEQENDYLGELEQSILRKPTDITVWMVNRILNAATGKEHEFWLGKLSIAATHSLADKDAKESALEFIKYQREKI